jgi:hypothetical protein
MADMEADAIIEAVEKLADAIKTLAYSGASVFGTTDAKTAIVLANEAVTAILKGSETP